MRLKYKIWDNKNKCWFKPIYRAYEGRLMTASINQDGSLLFNCLGINDIPDGNVHESVFNLKYNQENDLDDELKRFEVVYYTGLKDKNGKEIYEGYIVRFIKDINVKEEGYLDRTVCVECVGLVVWCNEEYDYKVSEIVDGDFSYLCTCESIEVIGNICENRELID